MEAAVAAARRAVAVEACAPVCESKKKKKKKTKGKKAKKKGKGTKKLKQGG